MVFLAVYVVVFMLLTLKLKKAFPLYFNEHKKRLYILGTTMIFSLIAQALFRVFTNINASNNFITPSLRNNTWAFPIFEFFTQMFMFFVPFAAIMYSLKLSIRQRIELNKQIPKLRETMH